MMIHQLARVVVSTWPARARAADIKPANPSDRPHPSATRSVAPSICAAASWIGQAVLATSGSGACRVGSRYRWRLALTIVQPGVWTPTY